MGEIDIDKNAPLAFVLVIFAGSSTAIGAAVVYVRQLVRLASKPVLASGLGFSAGVMLYVSFVEIGVKSLSAFADHGFEDKDASSLSTLCFFIGLFMMKVIGWVTHKLAPEHKCCHDIPDHLVPGPQGASLESPESDASNGSPQAEAEETPVAAQDIEVDVQQKVEADNGKDHKLQAMGLKTALAIGIHNFPEGLATFVATLADPAVGVTLAVAIAIHNVPEGLCVALPIYYATGSRHRGFLWALLSGLSEPVGALIGYAVIKGSGEDLNQLVYGILFGVVAGMMVGITITELLPTAQRYDPADKYLTWSVMVGMMVMAASLILFQY